MIRTSQRICPRISRGGQTAVAVVASWIALVNLATALGSPQAIRGTDGSVACLVSAAPDSPQGQSQLSVQVRAPGSKRSVERHRSVRARYASFCRRRNWMLPSTLSA